MNIRTICLGILHHEDATGYEINKLVAEGRFSHFIDASYGSIYPALTKLTEEGLTTWREESQVGKPARKIYSITPAGRQELINTLKDGPSRDIFRSEFLFVCIYSHLLEQGEITKIIDQKINTLKQELQNLLEMEGVCDLPTSRFAIGYGVSHYENSINFIEKNRHLLEDPELRQQMLEEAHNDQASLSPAQLG